MGALEKVTLPGGREIEYVLDATHRRVGKRVDGTLMRAYLYGNTLPNVGALARPLTYPYDTYVPIVAELDGSGALVARFVYGTKLNVPDYMIRGGTTYGLITDERGSVRLVVDVATGDIAQRIDYDAWGVVTSDTNPGFQPFGFAGGLYDPDTGLVRFGARDYDPSVGRWTGKDPIGFYGGQGNLYGYVGDDPVDWVDPVGGFPAILVPVAIVAGSAAGGAVGGYFGRGRTEDAVFGAAVGILTGVGIVGGQPIVFGLLGAGASLIWSGPGATVVGCVAGAACNEVAGPAGPYFCPSAESAAQNAISGAAD